MTALRPISIAGMQTYELASQPSPQVGWIKIADMVIDDRYQRPLEKNNLQAIRRIAADFRWSRFSPVLVAPIEGGRYAIIDGQHRAHAAALCGIESIPAMISLVAPEEQALAFIEINTRQIKVSGYMVYRASLAAGETWAVACRDAVEAAGCKLMTTKWTTDRKKPGMVFAVDAIRKLVDAGHAQAVTNGLAALMAYDPESTANFSDTLLRPFLAAAAECGGTTEELLNVLRAKKPWLVIEAADRMAEQDGKAKATCRREFFAMLMRRERAAA